MRPDQHHVASLGCECSGAGICTDWRVVWLWLVGGVTAQLLPPCKYRRGQDEGRLLQTTMRLGGGCGLRVLPGAAFHTGAVVSAMSVSHLAEPGSDLPEALQHTVKAFNIYQTSGPCQ